MHPHRFPLPPPLEGKTFKEREYLVDFFASFFVAKGDKYQKAKNIKLAWKVFLIEKCRRSWAKAVCSFVCTIDIVQSQLLLFFRYHITYTVIECTGRNALVSFFLPMPKYIIYLTEIGDSSSESLSLPKLEIINRKRIGSSSSAVRWQSSF